MEVPGHRHQKGRLMIARLFRFNGGVKPDYHKEESTSLPIATIRQTYRFWVLPEAFSRFNYLPMIQK